jgi:hypothetical protein
VFVTRFSFFGELSGFRGLPFAPFEAAVLVRAVILAICVVAWVRHRQAAPVPVPRAEPALAAATT